MSQMDYDVIVVGSGIAGHCAALAALERNARVLMIEAAPEAGGTSKLSTGMIMAAGTRFQRERDIEDDSADLYDHYMNINQWAVQPAVARRLCYDGGPTVEWLADNGVEILDVWTSGTESAPRGHVTHGGSAILEALSGSISNYQGFDFALGSRVDRLLVREGEVSGIAMGDEQVSAPAVILACGGLGGNAEMQSHWHPDAFIGAQGPIGFVGTPYSRGDHIKLGMQVDAQIVNGHGLRSPLCVFRTAYLPSFALVVNQLGRRYCDETINYGVGEVLLASQPGGLAYILFDDAVKRSLQKSSDVAKFVKLDLAGSEEGMALWQSEAIDGLVATHQISRAESVEELALALGIPPANLVGSVNRYNRFVAVGGDGDYFKALKGVPPCATPPFYAAKILRPYWVLTGAGLRIDENAAVVHETSDPIPGLYAAGETAGNVLGTVYFGSGNSLACCTVFGRIAGYQAAERAALASSATG